MRNKTAGRDEIIISNLPELAIISIVEQGARMASADRHFCVHCLEENAVRLAGLAAGSKNPDMRREYAENYRQHTAVIQILTAFAN